MSEWKALKLPDCLEKTATVVKIPKKKFLVEGQYPIISQEKGVVNGYWNEKEDVVKAESPLIVFGDHTQVLKHIDFDFVVGADGVKLLQPKSFLDSKYLFYFLMGNPVKTLGYARHYRLLKELDIRYPSLTEQKRIVTILDEAFAGIDTAIANTEKNLANTHELFESYLNALFRNPRDGWVHSTLGGVCKFQGGSQPPKSEFSPDCKEGYIRLIQIRDYKSDKHIVFIPKEKARRFCDKTDVMIGRYGPPLFQILRGLNGAYNVALMKAIPDESKITKDFLYYFLKNGDILQYIINASSRAAGQSGINKATIEPYPIAYPSLEEQANIVSSLDGLLEDIQRLETIYQEKLAALKELKQSLLQKAFSGELTAEGDKLMDEAVA